MSTKMYPSSHRTFSLPPHNLFSLYSSILKSVQISKEGLHIKVLYAFLVSYASKGV
jgi:hypothetical protein